MCLGAIAGLVGLLLAVTMQSETQEKRGLARFVQGHGRPRPCCLIVTGGTPVPLGHVPTR